MIEIAIRKRVGGFTLAPELCVGQEIVTLFGHSGAGKTLTLEAIAGLIEPDEGTIQLGGSVVFDAARRIRVPPHARNTGYLVQNYALFPHLTVAQNIGYGIAHLPKRERRARIHEFLRLLHLEELEDRRPGEISGGQSQRVALARALARRPPVLLLDEPFAALDPGSRTALRQELRHLARELGLSVLLVTHDLTEAYSMGERMAVIDRGAILQVGPRDEVLNRPRTVRAAELLNVRNILPGRVLDRDGTSMTVETAVGRIEVAHGSGPPGAAVHAAIRADRILLERRERPSAHHTNRLAGTIVSETAYGSSHTLFVRVEGARTEAAHHLEVDVPAHPYEVMGVARQRDWSISIPPDAVHVIDE